MPADLTPTGAPEETESPMFAPIPSWERNRKRRGFGRVTHTVAPETRTFADPERRRRDPEIMTETIATRPVMTDPLLADEPLATPAGAAFAEPPVYVSTTAVRKNSAAPVAIAAAVIALGGLAAAGWYASQPHDTGIAQLTPGSADVVTTPLADTSVNPPVMATNTPMAPPDVQPPAATATPARQHATLAAAAPRTRPAADATSVEEAGVNTAAALPSAPQPYAPSAPAMTATPATPEPVVIAPPAVVTPAPATPPDVGAAPPQP